MKIIIQNNYSQRDWRWRWKNLGTSVLTIGNSGCLLTAYAMAAGMRPDDLNVALRQAGGYAQGALIKHPYVATVSRRWVFNKLSDSYDNEKVKAQIKQNGFCIVKLTNGLFPQHWVVFLGNQRMIDPWTGKNEPTNKYGSSYQKYVDLTVY